MKKSEAIEAIDASLARGSSTPATWVENRDTYIAERAAELRACVIDPRRVEVIDESYGYGVKDQLKGTDVFGIARRGDNWLLFAPALGTFSLAFGSDESTLSILGFASSDALAEWLG